MLMFFLFLVINQYFYSAICLFSNLVNIYNILNGLSYFNAYVGMFIFPPCCLCFVGPYHKGKWKHELFGHSLIISEHSWHRLFILSNQNQSSSSCFFFFCHSNPAPALVFFPHRSLASSDSFWVWTDSAEGKSAA